MGDLIVTCTSKRSRNRHVGEELGSGKTVQEIIAGMNQVAEGVKAASVMGSPTSTASPCRSPTRWTPWSTTVQPWSRPTAG